MDNRGKHHVLNLLWAAVLAGLVWVLLSAAIGRVRSAPAPMPRAAVPVQIAPGDWVLVWGGSAEPMPLGKSSYAWGRVWSGWYSWDPKSRVFGVTESYDGKTSSTWWVTLDADGRGTSYGDFSGVKVRVRKPAQPERLKIPKGER